MVTADRVSGVDVLDSGVQVRQVTWEPLSSHLWSIWCGASC